MENRSIAAIPTPEAQGEEYGVLEGDQYNVREAKLEDGQDNEEQYNSYNSKHNSVAIDRDLLTQRLKDLPAKKLREIISNQIDLEIQLKHKELNMTTEEIGKCESQMIALRKFFEIPSLISLNNEPNDFTVKYSNLLDKSLSAKFSSLSGKGDTTNANKQVPQNDSGPLETKFTYRTRSATSSLRTYSSMSKPPSVIGCLYRRTDGVIVKLTCPDCNRSNFSSAQGFLNHSRIAHSKEYTSQDGAALQCGEILPDAEQDEEGLASLLSLKAKGLEPSRNLNVNEVYFHGLSNTLNTVHEAAMEKSMSPLDFGPSFSESRHFHMSTEPEKNESELMKKMIDNGIAKDPSDYQKLVKEAQSPVPNSHLLLDEEDPDHDSYTHTDSEGLSPRSKQKRKLSSTNPLPKEPPESLSSPTSHSDLNPDPPLPKIKLKLRANVDDKNKSKRRKR